MMADVVADPDPFGYLYVFCRIRIPILDRAYRFFYNFKCEENKFYHEFKCNVKSSTNFT